MLSLRLFKILFGLSYFLTALAKGQIHYRETSLHEITGEQSLLSKQQRPFQISSIRIGNTAAQSVEDAPRFLIQGGLHGNETMTSEFVEWLADRVRNKQSLLNQLPAGSTLDFLPRANPDAYGLSRYNSKQVNLNRNFGVLWGLSSEPHGESAFSEPETQALRSLMQTRSYLAAVDVHGYINWVVAPSPPEALQMQDHPLTPLYYSWIQEIRNNLSTLDGYELKKAALLGDGGSFEDWAFWENQTMSFCLEMYLPRRFTVIGMSRQKIDTFKTYEEYIMRMFSSAIMLREKFSTDEVKTIAEKDRANKATAEQKVH